MLKRIVSGAQTGADRAALDAAISLGIPCGGWVPKGRLDELGVIPAEYPNLVEAEDSVPDTRTRLNVRDSDATVIFSHGPLFGGSLLTDQFARELCRPCLVLDMTGQTVEQAAIRLRQWFAELELEVLNVAGPRASHDEGIYRAVFEVLRAAFETG